MSAMLIAVGRVGARNLIAGQIEFGECRDGILQCGVGAVDAGIEMSYDHTPAFEALCPEPVDL
jgi:hypothetical protein